MNIEIKKSKKPIKYDNALKFMEKRLLDLSANNSSELIWILEHDDIFTAGTNFKQNEINDKSNQMDNHESCCPNNVTLHH